MMTDEEFSKLKEGDIVIVVDEDYEDLSGERIYKGYILEITGVRSERSLNCKVLEPPACAGKKSWISAGNVEVYFVEKICPTCDGTGLLHYKEECPDCKGQGVLCSTKKS